GSCCHTSTSPCASDLTGCTQPSRMARSPRSVASTARWQIPLLPGTSTYDARFDLPGWDRCNTPPDFVCPDPYNPVNPLIGEASEGKAFWRQGWGNFYDQSGLDQFPDVRTTSASPRDRIRLVVGSPDRQNLKRLQMGREEALMAVDDTIGYIKAQMG